MKLGDLIDWFLRDRGISRSPATVEYYRRRLCSLRKLAGDQEHGSIEPIEFTAWLSAGAGGSPTTQRHDIVAFQQLQGFALAQGLIEKPWLAKLEKPVARVRDRLPTADEIRRLLQRASKPFQRIFNALRSSGARPGELVRLRIEDLFFDRSEAILEEHKTSRATGKKRVIPISARLEKILRIAMAGRQMGPVFLSPRGNAWSVAGLTRTFARLRDAAGLPKDLCLYLIRHEFGTRLCREHGVEVARQILGHSTSITTSRYVHFQAAELAKLIDETE